MAPAPRPPAQHLSFLAEAAQTTPRWGLFSLLRRLEALAPALPRIGLSRLPTQNIAELAQVPHLGFASRTLHKIEAVAGRARVTGYWLGLLGPMGPMPLHITEYAHYEARYATSRPFGRFMDLLAGRMLQFFYRAWADSQPAVMADRAQDDPFAIYLARLSGATLGADQNSALPPRARLHYAALFASRRSAASLEDALSHLLCQPLRILEYQPRWQKIEEGDRSRLGQHFCELGSDALLGSRVRTVSDAFRVVIQTKSLRQYEALLPHGAHFAIAAEALDAFAPSHLEWDIALEIAQDDVPRGRLDGRTRLGWTSWVGKDLSATSRQDAHLRRTRRHHETLNESAIS